MNTELSAAVMIGRIQSGAELGPCATVIVPACAVPVAAGTLPYAPSGPTEPDGVFVELPPQAAIAIAATAARTATFVPVRANPIIGPPYPRAGRTPSGGSDAGAPCRGRKTVVESLVAAFLLVFPPLVVNLARTPAPGGRGETLRGTSPTGESPEF